MEIHTLKANDIHIIGQCLRACVDGPFFPDWEFSTLFGLERAEVSLVLDAWPAVDFIDSEIVQLAVLGALNNLIGYPHGCDDQWAAYISVGPAGLSEVRERWSDARKAS